ncbi:MAG: response regulator [Kiritimatiellae bacterium]|nr:response regulator [Kiritimatiellia bacterium]MDD5522428.1 response regulator [Kiritimatiellia bacterium]
MARILLIDDEPNILCILSNLLQSDGHSIAGTLRGDKAKQYLRSEEHLDLMVTDLRMWPVDGMNLIKAAREIRPSMPVVIISAHITPEVEEEAAKLGVEGILRKPWSVDEFLTKVREVLQQATTNVTT